MSERHRRTGYFAVILIVVVGIGIYLGAYFLLCSPGVVVVDANGKSYTAPQYTPDSQLMTILFSPAHALDRRIRPGNWATNIYIVDSMAPIDEAPKVPPLLDDYDALLKAAANAYFSGDIDGAMEQFNAAVKANPHEAEAYLTRGTIHQELGNWQAALEDYEKASDINPKEYSAWNNLAMLLAACPDDEIRNGAQAAEYAQRACELTEWKHPAVLNTLAIAYAELRDWQAATDVCDTQLGQLGDGPMADEFRVLRELFFQEMPYRLTATQ